MTTTEEVRDHAAFGHLADVFKNAAEFDAWLDERDAQVRANAIVEAAEAADRLLVLDSYCDTPSIEERVQPDDPRFAMTVRWAIPATMPVESFGSWLREWGDQNSSTCEISGTEDAKT